MAKKAGKTGNTAKHAGRPSVYEPTRHPDWALALARRGLSTKEIAREMGINPDTLNEWRKNHLEFSVSLRQGKSEAISKIENVLFKRAMGFEYEETRNVYTSVEETVDGPDGPTTKTRLKPLRVERTKKFIPPDVGAQTLILKNMAPETWRDKREEELTGTIAVKIIKGISMDQL